MTAFDVDDSFRRVQHIEDTFVVVMQHDCISTATSNVRALFASCRWTQTTCTVLRSIPFIVDMITSIIQEKHKSRCLRRVGQAFYLTSLNPLILLHYSSEHGDPRRSSRSLLKLSPLSADWSNKFHHDYCFFLAFLTRLHLQIGHFASRQKS